MMIFGGVGYFNCSEFRPMVSANYSREAKVFPPGVVQQQAICTCRPTTLWGM